MFFFLHFFKTVSCSNWRFRGQEIEQNHQQQQSFQAGHGLDRAAQLLREIMGLMDVKDLKVPPSPAIHYCGVSGYRLDQLLTCFERLNCSHFSVSVFFGIQCFFSMFCCEMVGEIC